MAAYLKAGLVGLSVAVALVCASCGLVIRGEEAEPVDGVVSVDAPIEETAAAAPTLPPTTIWVEPELIGPTASTVFDPEEIPSGLEASSEPVPAPTTTTEPPRPSDPWCPSFAAFVDAGAQFTLAQKTASRDELVDWLAKMRYAAAAMTQVGPEPLAPTITELNAELDFVGAELSSLPSKEAVVQRFQQLVGGITLLVDPLIVAAPQYCPTFGSSAVSSKYGYDNLAQG